MKAKRIDVKQSLAKRMSRLSHIHHHAKYIERAEAIYAVGLLHLAAIFYFPPFSCPQFSLRQTFLQLPRHTMMLPPTRPLLCELYCHRRTRQRTQPPSQAQTAGQEHSHFSRALPPLLALHQHYHPVLHHPHSHIPRL